MSRTELILVMSTTLFAAFVLGWLLRWAYGRLNQVNSVDVTELDDLASRLHDAEEALDETRSTLIQKEHELAAAMDGIGHARREAEALRRELDELKSDGSKSRL